MKNFLANLLVGVGSLAIITGVLALLEMLGDAVLPALVCIAAIFAVSVLLGVMIRGLFFDLPIMKKLKRWVG